MDAGRLFTRSVFASALVLGLLGAPTAATAQSNTPPSVRTMPDQETYDGRNMVVWGDFADAQIASGQLYFWTIDFGDGTAPAQGSIRLQSGVLKNEAGTTLNSSPTNVADLSQRFYHDPLNGRIIVGVNHTFTGVGRAFRASLTVEDQIGARDSKDVVIQVGAKDNQSTLINVAIQEHLRFLFSRRSNQGLDNGKLRALAAAEGNYYASRTFPVSDTGAALLGLCNQGYTPSAANIARHPYAECALYYTNYLLSVLKGHTINVSGSLDGNGNGKGVWFTDSYAHDTYQNGVIVMSLIGTLQPDMDVASFSFPGGNASWKLRDVIQDVVDAASAGQHDAGWGYTYQDGRRDGSTNQWPVLILYEAGLPANGFNSVVHSSVLTKQATALANLQAGATTNEHGRSLDGGIGYGSATSWVTQGKTGGGMVALKVVQNQISSPASRVSRAKAFVERFWNIYIDVHGADDGWNGGSRYDSLYDVYSLAKGLRVQEINTLTIGGQQVDWYKDLSGGIIFGLMSNGNGYGTVAAGTWPAKGYIEPNSWYRPGRVIGTSYSLLTLTQSLVGLPPIADASGGSATGGRRVVLPSFQAFTLDASKSATPDPNRVIEIYEWDLNGDGAFLPSDAPITSIEEAEATIFTGDVKTYAPVIKALYTTVGTRNVTLRVSDNGNPRLTDTDNLTIEVTLSNVPPEARVFKITPAQVNILETVTFDEGRFDPLDQLASGTFDPNYEQALQGYLSVGGDPTDIPASIRDEDLRMLEWDLDGDGVYEVAYSITTNPNGSRNVTATRGGKPYPPTTVYTEAHAYTIRVRASDRHTTRSGSFPNETVTGAGTASVELVVVNDAPSAGFIDAPDIVFAPSTGAVIPVVARGFGDNEGQKLTYKWSWTGGSKTSSSDDPPAGYDSETTVGPVRLGEDTENSRVIRVQAVDEGGGQSAEVTKTIRVMQEQPLVASIYGRTRIQVNVPASWQDASVPVSGHTISGRSWRVLSGTTAIVSGVTTPALDWTPPSTGTFTVELTVFDGLGRASAPTKKTVTVSSTAPANDAAPTVPTQPLQVTTFEDVPIPIDFGATDADGDALSYTITSPAKGALTGLGDVRLYTPTTNANGSDSFQVTASDGKPEHDRTFTVTVSIAPVADAPVATNHSLTTAEDAVATIQLAALVTDPDDGPSEDSVATYGIVGTSNGTASIVGSTVTFTPNLDFNGVASVTYNATDSSGRQGGTATVSITVEPRNDAPKAGAVALSALEDTLTDVTLAGTDVDKNETLTFTILTLPARGTLTLDGTTAVAVGATVPATLKYLGELNYAGQSGNDSFTYRVTDGGGLNHQGGTGPLSAEGSVNVAFVPVNDRPVVTLAAQVFEVANAGGTITLTAGSSDVENDALTFAWKLDGVAQSGKTAATASFPLSLPAGQTSKSFTVGVTASDATLTAIEATATITITDDKPTASFAQTAPLVISNVEPALFDDGSFMTAGADGTVEDSIAKWEWSFGDGQTKTILASSGATSGDTSHTYALTADTLVTVTLTVTDNDGSTHTTSQQVQVIFNTAPTWADLPPVTMLEDGVQTIDLHAFLSDRESPDADFTLTVDSPTTGFLNAAIDADGRTLRLAPTVDQHGSGTVTIKARDPRGPNYEVKTSFGVSVLSVNDAPTLAGVFDGGQAVGGGGTVALVEDGGSRTLTLTGLSVGPANESAQTLTVTAVSSNTLLLPNPAASAVAGGQATLTVTPNADRSGQATVTVTVADTGGGATSAVQTTFVVEVAPVNDAPTLQAIGNVALNEDASATTVQIAGAFVGPSEERALQTLAFEVESSDTALVPTPVISGYNAAAGTAQLAFAVPANRHGSAIVTVQASDGTGEGALTVVRSFTVTVAAVNDAPSFDALGALTIGEDSGAHEVAVTGITPGPFESEDVLLTAVSSDPTLVPAPSVSKAAGASTATLTLAPAANRHGQVTITVVANDQQGGAQTFTRAFTVTVTPENDAPVAVADAAQTNEDAAVTVAVLANDSDVDGDALTIASVGAASLGTVAIAGSQIVYTPNPHAFGADAFTYTITDGKGGEATAEVAVTIVAVNDAPVAVADAAEVDEDQSVFIDVLANDTDTEGTSLSVASVGLASKGSVALVGGVLRYTPVANWNGTDAFTYVVRDGGGATATGQVTITVDPVNDAPVALAQVVAAQEDTARTVTLTGTDIDGDPLTYTVLLGEGLATAKGALAPTADPRVFTYTPKENQNGQDSFSFEVNDGTVDSAPAVVTITIAPVNDRPVATGGSAEAVEDTPLALTLAGTDTEGSALTFQVTRAPSKGTVSGGVGAARTYTPSANANGTDSFDYTVNDGALTSAAGTFTITIESVNDAPVARIDGLGAAVAANQAGGAAITVSGAGSTDLDGTIATFAWTVEPASGATPATATGAAPTLALPLGRSTVRLTVTDDLGATASAARVVDVAPATEPAALTLRKPDLGSGDGQQGTVGQALAQPLVAIVEDAFGNPVAGIAVLVTASGGSAPASATSDASGRVAVRPTLGGAEGAYTYALALAGGQGGSVGFDASALADPAPATAKIVKVAGDGQQATVGTAFAAPFAIRVTDRFGNPLAGQAVTWTSTSGRFALAGGGDAATTAATTDAKGEASALGLAGTTTAATHGYQVALAANLAVQASFSGTAISDRSPAQASLVAISGDGQTGTVDAPLALPFVVEARDRFGNPAPGLGVTFTALDGGGFGGAASAGATAADPTGRAQATATLPSAAGTGKRFEARLTAAPERGAVGFTAAARAARSLADAKIEVIAGGGQTGTVGKALAQPVVFAITDTHGNPLDGVGVSFEAPLPGGSTVPAQVTTGLAGQVSATVTLGSQAGAQTLVARLTSATQVARDVTFDATADAAAANLAIAPHAGLGQSGTVGAALAAPLAVLVRDRFQNPVSGVQVRWIAPAGGAVDPAIATTDASGLATTAATLGSAEGTQAFRAELVLAPATATTLNASSEADGATAKLTVIAGDGQRGPAGKALPVALKVRLTDAFGNPLTAEAVTFTALSTGALAPMIDAASTVTDGLGYAEASVTLGTQAGAQQVSASAAGRAATFTLTADADPTLADLRLVAVTAGPLAATAGKALGQALVVEAQDAHGNPVGGQQVVFAGPSGSSVGTAQAATDGAGRASTTFTAAGVAGSQAVVATLVQAPLANANRSVTFAVEVGADADLGSALLTKVSGDGASGVVGAALGAPGVVVLVTDANQNPLEGVAVAFTVTDANGAPVAQDAGGAPVTGADGSLAHQPKLGTKAGAYRVTAALLDGSAAPVAFDVVALADASTPPESLGLAVHAGSGQQGTVEQPLASPLVVQLLDRFGNPLALEGVAVGFSATGATLAGTQASTDAAGRAAMAVTKLATSAGSESITAALGQATAAFTVDARADAAPAQLALTAIGWSTPTAVVGSVLGDLVVEVRDRFGNLVPGVTVEFSATRGSVAPASATTAATGSVGRATTAATLGLEAGTNTFAAAVAGGGGAQARVEVTAEGTPASGAGEALTIRKVGGDGQTGQVRTALANDLVVEVVDKHGNPVAGVLVTFAAPSEEAAIVAAGGGDNPAATGADGRAAARATLGARAGAQAFTATLPAGAGGAVASFAATALANPTTSLAKVVTVGGLGQRQTVGATLAQPFIARVTDVDGNPLAGVSVAFAAEDGSVSSATRTTDSAGDAWTIVTLGTSAGVHRYTATIAGQAAQTELTATADPETTATTRQLKKLAGDGQQAAVGASVALAATVTDRFGNALDGVAVRFRQTGGLATGESATAVSATTADGGRAEATVTLGRKAGAQVIRAEIEGAEATHFVEFALTATAEVDPGSAVLAIVSGDGQQGTVGTVLAAPFVVEVRDRFQNPIPGQSVRWSSTDGSVSAASTPTGADGRASVTATLGARAVLQRFAATVGEGEGASPSVELTATGRAERTLSTAVIRITGGDGQTAKVGEALPLALEVTVEDRNQNPIPSLAVTFSSSDAVVAAGARTTDADGRASVAVTLGATAGAQVVRAALDATRGVDFTLTAEPRDALADLVLVKAGGDGQQGTVGQALALPVVVRVEDAFGNPIRDIGVAFTAPDGTTGEAVLSGPDGRVSAAVTLAGTAGAQAIVARIAGTTGAAGEATFAATALADANLGAARLAKRTAEPLAGDARAQLAAALAVRVEDRFGNPLTGVRVRARALDGGSVLAPSGTSASDGRVETRVVLGATAGTQRFLFELRDQLAVTTTYEVTVAPTANPADAQLVKGSGDGQRGLINKALAEPLVARIQNAAGEPLAGIAVRVRTIGGVVPAGSEVVVSGADGLVRATVSLGASAGTQSFSLEVDGFPERLARYTATADLFDEARLAIVTPPPGEVAAGSSFGLAVRVVDGDGAPLALAGTVTARLASGTASGFNGTNVATLVNGVATFADLRHRFDEPIRVELVASNDAIAAVETGEVTVLGSRAQVELLDFAPGQVVREIFPGTTKVGIARLDLGTSRLVGIRMRVLDRPGEALPVRIDGGVGDPAPVGSVAEALFDGSFLTPGDYDCLWEVELASLAPGVFATPDRRVLRPFTLRVLDAAPRAIARTQQLVEASALGYLDGSLSSDPNGQRLAFAWEVASAPSGLAVVIADATAMRTSFSVSQTGPENAEGFVTFSLAVTAGGVERTATARTFVTAGKLPPVAFAGDDRVAVVGQAIELDGSGSADADGATDGSDLSFSWRTLDADGNETVQLLANEDAAQAAFVPERAGVFRFALTVTDADGFASEADVVTVRVLTADGSGPPAIRIARMDPPAGFAAGLGEEIVLRASGGAEAAPSGVVGVVGAAATAAAAVEGGEASGAQAAAPATVTWRQVGGTDLLLEQTGATLTGEELRVRPALPGTYTFEVTVLGPTGIADRALVSVQVRATRSPELVVVAEALEGLETEDDLGTRASAGTAIVLSARVAELGAEGAQASFDGGFAWTQQQGALMPIDRGPEAGALSLVFTPERTGTFALELSAFADEILPGTGESFRVDVASIQAAFVTDSPDDHAPVARAKLTTARPAAGSTVVVDLSESFDLEPGALRFEVTGFDPPVVVTVHPDGTFSFLSKEPGVHRFRVVAIDQDGRRSEPVEIALALEAEAVTSDAPLSVSGGGFGCAIGPASANGASAGAPHDAARYLLLLLAAAAVAARLRGRRAAPARAGRA